ncbi:DUF4810 domain-containing protein [Bordetella sputigena]|uniref:DUF4810 domain-containing protein n=1 Tax=Bordetella sputigena TaxID=1416810 RepID=UPI0039EF093C
MPAMSSVISSKVRAARKSPVPRLFALFAIVGGLTACAPQQKPLYSWQAYEPQVYAYLKDDGADYATQVQALENNIQTARANNQALPPGFHAHLGMLYLKMGNGDKAAEQLQSEKQEFPESAPFMDFLMRNAGKPGSGQDHPLAAQSVAAPPAPPAATDTRNGS